jgi:Tfp pilus assembly protein PilN
MANINLVPEVKKEQARNKQINVTVTTVAFVVGGIVVAAIVLLGSLYGYRTAMIASANKNIEKINTELKPYKELEDSVATLENGLREIKGIVAGGRDWTAFYGDIEKATPADVQFTTFKVTGNSVSADVTGKNVQSIDRFMRSFSAYKGADGNNMYSNVVVDGYSTKDNGMVSFQVKFDVTGASK